MLLAIGIVLLIIGETTVFSSEVGGVYWYWAWFLVRPQETWLGLGGPIPMERIFAITLIVCTYYRYRISQHRSIAIGKPMKAFAAMVLINLLTIMTSVWRGNSFDTSVAFLKLFAFFFVAAIVLNTPQRVTDFIWIYVLGIAWEGFSAIKNYYTNPYFAQGIQRAEGSTATWSDPNAEAFNLVFAVPIMVALLIASDKWKPRFLLIVIMVMCVIALILTGSRSGFVDLILLFLLMAVRSKKKLVLIPAFVFLSGIVWIVTPSQYQERYMTILGFAEDPTAQLDTSQGESAYGRIVGFRVAMMMLADHPILGVGVGNFPFAWRFGPYTFKGFKGWHQPHNLAGQILSEQGLVGGIAFIAFLVIVFQTNATGIHKLGHLDKPPPVLTNLGKMLPVVLICMLVSGFSSHSYYRYNWYLMCLIATILCQTPQGVLPKPRKKKLRGVEKGVKGGTKAYPRSTARSITCNKWITTSKLPWSLHREDVRSFRQALQHRTQCCNAHRAHDTQCAPRKICLDRSRGTPLVVILERFRRLFRLNPHWQEWRGHADA